MNWWPLVKLMFRLLTALLLIVGLSTLSGCGGGDDEQKWVGQAPPASYDLVLSSRNLDLAIVGDGLFVLQAKAGDPLSYSRLGRLDLDHQGQLIHTNGSMVMGVTSESDSTPAPMARAPLAMPARPTARVSLEGNLDSRVANVSEPFDPNDSASYSRTFSMGVYTPTFRALTLYFRKVSNSQSDLWAVRASLDGRAINAELVLQFTADGWLAHGTASTLHIPAGGADQPEPIKVDLGGFSQLGASYSMDGPWNGTLQDGYGPGALTAVLVDSVGRLNLYYDNGQQVSGGQLVFARFTMADRLHRLGESSWQCTDGCAPPLLGTLDSALMGEIVSGALNTLY